MSDEILREFDIPPSLGNYFEGMADEIIRLRKKLAAAERQLEVERMRLAACGVAALGYFEGCADEYRSASLDDVLRLHARLAALTSHMNEVHEVLGGTDTVLTLEAALHVVAKLKAAERVVREWQKWADDVASGHPDAPTASLDHEVRSVIENKYGIRAALATPITPEDA